MIETAEKSPLLERVTSCDWTYSVYDRSVTAIAFPVFTDFLELWHEKANGAALPAWSDFDFFDFRGWHGRIYLGEVTEDRKDFRYRLFGTAIVELLEDDYTGRLFSEVEEGNDADKQVEMDLLARQIDEGLPIHMKGPIDWQGREYQMMETLALPLADDGEHTSHILAATTKC